MCLSARRPPFGNTHRQFLSRKQFFNCLVGSGVSLLFARTGGHWAAASERFSAMSPCATRVTFTVGAISGFCLPFFFWCRGFFWHRERRGTLGPSVGDISRRTDRVDVNILIVFSSWLCCQGCEPAPRVSSKCYTTSILTDLHVSPPSQTTPPSSRVDACLEKMSKACKEETI